MSSYGRPGITRGRETTLKFCGVKIYYQLFFSFTHHLVGFLSDWQSQCLEDIMVADQNVACKREVKWWQKAMHNMKLLCCIYERLLFMKIVLFLTFPGHVKMELLYISNERCNNWLRLLEKYVSTLLLTILYAVTTFSGSVFCLLTCFDWCFPYHY